MKIKIALLLLISIVLSWFLIPSRIINTGNKNYFYSANTVVFGLARADCQIRGGKFNPCGSTCRKGPDVFCAAVCVVQCDLN